MIHDLHTELIDGYRIEKHSDSYTVVAFDGTRIGERAEARSAIHLLIKLREAHARCVRLMTDEAARTMRELLNA